jgi:6-pyruvoyl-tetrahydropterin synthase
MKETFAIRVYKEYFNFASCHFLIFGDGTREPLHGHNYQVQVKVEGEVVGGDLVIDFIPFKPMVKGFCDEMDHLTILPEHNPHLEISHRDGQVEVRHSDGSFFSFPEQDVRILPVPNTSTEMLAKHLTGRIHHGIKERMTEARVHAIEVQVEESSGQCGICRFELD